MKKIEIIITEEAIVKTTGYDFEQLAIANGYQEDILNPEFNMFDIEKSDIPRHIKNPQSPIEFLSSYGLSIMIQSIASPIISRNMNDAQMYAQDASRNIIDAVIANSTINIG